MHSLCPSLCVGVIKRSYCSSFSPYKVIWRVCVNCILLVSVRAIIMTNNAEKKRGGGKREKKIGTFVFLHNHGSCQYA